MFTGIIEEIGEIVSVSRGARSAVLAIRGPKVTSDGNIGDSIAVNGVCLTATRIENDIFKADVMAETLRRSSLNWVAAGSKVNLERAMPAYGRFGGHIVSGHIDGTGVISSLKKEDNAVWVTVTADMSILKYIIEKGSIAIDGISLTVAYVDSKCFKVSVIPHTASETTLLNKKEGDIVNLENDVIGKYVDKMLNGPNDSRQNGISSSFLMENGYL